jgi:hypothetical protein
VSNVKLFAGSDASLGCRMEIVPLAHGEQTLSSFQGVAFEGSSHRLLSKSAMILQPCVFSVSLSGRQRTTTFTLSSPCPSCKKSNEVAKKMSLREGRTCLAAAISGDGNKENRP